MQKDGPTEPEVELLRKGQACPSYEDVAELLLGHGR
jgi:hypothetical protein